MMTDYEMQRNQEIYNKLNETKKQDPKSPEFWLWSDIASLYPKFLSRLNLIPVDLFSDKLHTTIIKNVSAFTDKKERPIHIKTIDTNDDTEYTIMYNPKKTDQKLTRLACEYLFRNYYYTEFTQAYFLFPNMSFYEISEITESVEKYRIYQDIENIKKRLAATILRRTNQNQAIVNNAFNIVWSKFFDTKDFNVLIQKYTIEHSPTDHIQPNKWRYIYAMFRDIAIQLEQHTELDFEDVKRQSKASAKIARHIFEKYKEKPEQFLSTTDFSIPAKQIDTRRKQFWLENYITNSL